MSTVSGDPCRTVTLVRQGNLLYISPDGLAPTPVEVCRLLHEYYTYNHRVFLHGYKARCPVTGVKKKVEITQRRLYDFDARGRLRTRLGFLKKTCEALRSAGFSLRYIDYDAHVEKTSPHPRPDRYVTDLGNVTYHFKFRQRQEECLRAIVANQGGLVHAVTGFGKMALIVMTCLLYPRAKIHVVTKRLPLVNKLVEYLTRYIPNVGQFGDGSKFFGDRVTVFCSKSLHHSDFDADILLCDEGHELLAEETVKPLSRYTASRNFVLTATPKGRSDGADIRLEALFGPTIFYLPYWEAEALGLVPPIEVRWRDVHLTFNPAAGLEAMDPERKRRGVWFNDPRNDMIAEDVAACPQDEQFMVLTDTLYHAAEIYRRVRHNRARPVVLVYDKVELSRYASYKAENVLPADAPRMTAALKEQYRRRFEAGEIDVVSTPTWEVGVDPTFLQRLYVASAFSSEIKAQQVPGRATRINTQIGKQKGIIYDYRDQFDDGFRKAARERQKVYQAQRWLQTIKRDADYVPLANK